MYEGSGGEYTIEPRLMDTFITPAVEKRKLSLAFHVLYKPAESLPGLIKGPPTFTLYMHSVAVDVTPRD